MKMIPTRDELRKKIAVIVFEYKYKFEGALDEDTAEEIADKILDQIDLYDPKSV